MMAGDPQGVARYWADKFTGQRNDWEAVSDSRRGNVGMSDADKDSLRLAGMERVDVGAVNKGDAQENNLWTQGRQQQQSAYDQAGGVAQMYRNQAQGLGQSAAQAQLQQGTDQGIAAQMAMANSARGGAQAMLAARSQAQQQGAQMQAQSNQQAAVLRAQEQAQAMQGLSGAVGMQGQMAGQMRGQDADLRGSNMQFGLQERAQNITQAQGTMQNRQYFEGLRADATMKNAQFEDQARARQIAQQQSEMERDRNRDNSLINAGATVAGALVSSSDAARKQNIQKEDKPTLNESLGKGVAALHLNTGTGGMQAYEKFAGMTMSDTRAKRAEMAEGIAQMYAQAQGMKEAGPSVSTAPREMMRTIEPYSYNYKPGIGEDTERRRFGVMAQDLEKTPMGASIVENTPKGKMVDAGKGVGVALAATSDLQKQIDELRAGVAQYGSNPPAVKGGR